MTLYLLRCYQFPCKLFIEDYFLFLNQNVALFYIFYLSLSLGLRVCLQLHEKVKGKRVRKLIHFNTEVE